MKFDWIEPDVLAASGTPITSGDLQSLREQGIGAIVSLTEHPLTIRKTIQTETFTHLGLEYLHAPIPDGFPPDFSTARQIIQFIDQMAAQGRSTFIHCQAGIGRTGTLLHAYFLAHGATLAMAQEKVRTGRPGCNFVNLSESQRAFLMEFARSF